MSLYYEAAAILANSNNVGGSLKSRIFKEDSLKSTPGQIFALIAEASKWSLVLKDAIEKCGLLTQERKLKLTPVLAILLAHDLLLAKNGVAAPANHVLKLAIIRHKARLGAEFTKARIQYGFASVDQFREAVDNGELVPDSQPASKLQHPRWIRINTLKTSLKEQLTATFAGYEKTDTLKDVLVSSRQSKIYFEDLNIPNLLALPPNIDLTESNAYKTGQIIFQDKASCFPAYLLDPQPHDGSIIDATAAPGNKTTHLAALVSSAPEGVQGQKVIAFERDKSRTFALQKMVTLGGADSVVRVKGSSNFLATLPDSSEFAGVGAILLDPSCSGTGIVGRDDAIQLHLPTATNSSVNSQPHGKSKKRKRDEEGRHAIGSTVIVNTNMDNSAQEEEPLTGKLSERLAALSGFQLHILAHAMRFPNARKITYSTCSIHFEENEAVVFRALASEIAKARGWSIMKREIQVHGLRSWPRRGVWEEGRLDCSVDENTKNDVLEACIRCDKGTEEGTMGFFVAGFVRDAHVVNVQDRYKLVLAEEEDEEEWNGFSNDEFKQMKDVTKVKEKPKQRKRKKSKRT